MSDLPKCTKCDSSYTYEYDGIYTCPECGNEWPKDGAEESANELNVVDSNGAELKDGDSVIVIKDLKLKGASSTIKMGTKVKNIRLTDGDHNIDCKIPGIGAIGLKSEFVKKVN